MTNKQIIIDGVDVSECDFVFVGKDKKAKISCWCNKLNFICKDNPNCYYKSWQRKEQECEELKEELQKYIDKEQREIELNKKRADSFKEMQRMLYGKFDGKSLIEKSVTNEQRP